MDDEKLQRVLGVIDDPAPVPEDFVEALWTDVRSTLERDHDSEPHGPTIIRLQRRPATAPKSTRRPLALIAAAAAIVLAGTVALYPTGEVDQQVPAGVPTVGPLPTVAPEPIIDDAQLACERFVQTTPDLAVLERDLRVGTEVIVDLDRARAAYRALLIDLDAAGLPASVAATLEVGAGSLDQARLRILEGDLEAAGRAVENATNQLNSARGLAFDELAACFP